MKLSAWIISYFGKEGKAREARKAAHTSQVEWLRGFGVPITILAQDYRKEDFLTGVKYITSPQVWPAQARNLLLPHFYAGDSLFGIFADNDSVLDPRFEGIENILDLDDLPGVDLFVPINPVNEPFNRKQQENKELYSKFLCFTRHLGITGNIMFLRNVGDVRFDEVVQPGEDPDFALEMAYKGYGVYRCDNLVLKELVTTSTLPWLATEGRQAYKDNLVNKWGDKGVTLRAGKLDRREFLSRYFRGPVNLQIPKAGVGALQPNILF